jgi:endonuclease YncB( thermonuclease family)
MAKSYIRKYEDFYTYDCKLSMFDGHKEIPIIDEKKSFQTIVVNRANKEFHFKLNNYYPHFDKLRDKDKKIILDQILKDFKDSRFEATCLIKSSYHSGSLSVINEKDKTKTPFDNIIERYTKDFLRVKKIKIKAKFLDYISPNEIMVSHNGSLKTVSLDLLDSSYDKMSNKEKQNLNEFMRDYFDKKKDKEMIIHATGIYDKNLFSKVFMGRECLNDTIYNIIDGDLKGKELIGKTFKAVLSYVTDGDTLVVYKNKEKMKIRLADIDSFEIDQKLGLESKKFLRDMIKNGLVTLKVKEIGDYGRYIATVYNEDRTLNLNQQMVANGYAFATSFNKSHPKYIEDQKRAKVNKKGMYISSGSVMNPKKHRDANPKKYKDIKSKYKSK